MAYITKAQVQEKSKALSILNKQYGIKASFSGSNSSSLKLTIHSGKIDFLGCALQVCLNTPDFSNAWRDNMHRAYCVGYLQVNHYYLERAFEGTALEYLQKAYAIMLQDHFDDSDTQTDYFCCAWYNNIHIGRWNKPYSVTV